MRAPVAVVIICVALSVACDQTAVDVEEPVESGSEAQGVDVEAPAEPGSDAEGVAVEVPTEGGSDTPSVAVEEPVERSSDAPAVEVAELDLENPAQRGSYAQGVVVGEQGKGLPLDVEAFLAGVRAGMTGESTLDAAQIQQAMTEFQAYVAEARTAQGEAALVAGEEFLAENGRREGVITTASGVQYEVLRAATGAQPGMTDRVIVHYRGTLLDGTEFDESYSGEEPATFGVTQVIPGFSEGLQLMQVGSQYRFYIPGTLGYGVNPRPGGKIGPNDTLIFEVELLGIESPGTGG